MRVRYGIAALALAAALASAVRAAPVHPVGLSQVEFADGNRVLALAVFYPAEIDETSPRFVMPFFVNLDLYADPPPARGLSKLPLVMFSHGRGSNGLYYAWFAARLASQGYVVAAPYHYRANTYDATIAYLANKLWQRPKDITLSMDFLLGDSRWGALIDPNRIGVAGHSQGGFTALWIGGAEVNADKYRAFQEGWRHNKMVPAHLRAALPLDPAPALDVHDPRVKAVFAMAPGIIKAFGMDEAGLAALKLPTYITVGVGDTQTPPKDNAEFAAEHIHGAELHIVPGKVDHEIFVNECDEEGKDEFPEACIDAPGVDRAKIHESVGDAALSFFASHLKGPGPQ